MSLSLVLIILLVVLVLGLAPVWPYNANTGWGAPGLFGVALLIILLLVLAGRI